MRNTISRILHEEFNNLLKFPHYDDDYYLDMWNVLNDILEETEKVKKGLVALDLNPPPKGQRTLINDVLFPQDPNDFSYFVSLGFPPKAKVMARHLDVVKRKEILGLIPYGELKQNEQYLFIKYTFEKYLPILQDGRYYIWVERCKSEELHAHMLVRYNSCMSDLRKTLHRIFGIENGHKFFCKIKPFKRELWNNYHIKDKKSYETYNKPAITNCLNLKELK